ncbi:MAG: hypothetical protein KUL80_04945 [Comamonas sp.]|nr:hypothetical protein [Comamonas sp.]
MQVRYQAALHADKTAIIYWIGHLKKEAPTRKEAKLPELTMGAEAPYTAKSRKPAIVIQAFHWFPYIFLESRPLHIFVQPSLP